MAISKAGSGKGHVTSARVGKTHTPMGKASGKGSGVNKRDSSVASAPAGGKTIRIRSGDVKRTFGSMSKYK